MTNITSLFSRLVLALALATGAGAAMAVPASYHVTLDTSGFSGDGYLDLGFGALGSADTATAVVSNVTGAVTGDTSIVGIVTGDLTSTATFINTDYGDLAQVVHFGGLFSFDVLFDFASTGSGSSFAVSLYDMAFNNLLNTDFAAVITLSPGDGASFTTFSQSATVTSLDAAAVPEPGQWLMMATGLLLLGAMACRRNV